MNGPVELAARSGAAGPQIMPSGVNVSTDGCFESLARLEDIEARLLLPGHGEPWRESPAAAVAAARATGRS